MRNVLFITAWYPADETDTQGIFVREHAKAAVRVANLHIVHIDRGPAGRPSWPGWVDRIDAQIAGGVPVRRLRPGLRGPALLENLVVLLLLVITLVQLRRGGFRPAIVHAHIHEAAFFAAVTAKVLRVPLVVTEHSTVFGRGALGALSVAKARWVARSAVTLMPVSHDLAASMAAHGMRSPYAVVPNTVDPSLFQHEPSRDAGRSVLFVGRLSAEKGVMNVLEAVAQLATVALVVAGDGPLRGEVERRTRQPDLAGRVRLCGEVPKEIVAELMGSADILVLPSERENLPCVILEALVSGLPVVASRVGGIPEVVDESCGVLIEPGDVGVLRDAIVALLDAPLDRRGIAERALARFGLEAVALRLDAVYAGAAA